MARWDPSTGEWEPGQSCKSGPLPHQAVDLETGAAPTDDLETQLAEAIYTARRAARFINSYETDRHIASAILPIISAHVEDEKRRAVREALDKVENEIRTRTAAYWNGGTRALAIDQDVLPVIAAHRESAT